jgi:hypothetical protein
MEKKYFFIILSVTQTSNIRKKWKEIFMKIDLKIMIILTKEMVKS